MAKQNHWNKETRLERVKKYAHLKEQGLGPIDMTITIPWTYNLSKNGRTGRNRGRVFVRQDVVTLQNELIDAFSDTGPWYYSKVWLDIHCEMPTRRSDAINVLDTIADAVKRGIGVDDTWFAIHKLDWSIKREDPMVTIRVFQTVNYDQKYCSSCCKLYNSTTEWFHRSTTETGLSDTCKTCLNARNAKQREKARNERR